MAVERDEQRSKAALLENAYAELDAQARAIQQENAQLLVDLQAFESQGEELTRQLRAAEDERRQASAERQSASEQLASTRIALGGMERSREAVQRDTASAAYAMQQLTSRVADLSRERDALRQQLELSRAQASQLENVASSLRTQAAAATAAAARAAAAPPPATDAAPSPPPSPPSSESEARAAAAEAHLAQLQRAHDQQAAELVQLQRALGTASYERDAALDQQRHQTDALTRLQATVTSQATVIQRLDTERAAAAAARASGPP
jgi:DNA repair exonuclease SbcCD ATPase subunit